MILRVATRNAGKLREFREILTPLGFTVQGVEDLPAFDIVEDGDTFTANALKKAEALLHRTGVAALADDSGLVVDALGGAPGVHSARYAGVDGAARDAANRQKLLTALHEIPETARCARFVCVLAYCRPEAAPCFFRGTVEGRIGHAARGANGFGYDPIFLLPPYERTMAELDAEDKHRVSHRGNALREFVAYLRAQA